MLKLALGPDWKMITPREFRCEALGLRLYVDATRFVAPSAREDVVGRSSLVTAQQGRVDYSEIRVTLPGGEIVHELRARYQVRDASPRVVIAGSPDQIERHRAELDAILGSATLDVEASTSACLAHLFADVDG
jgi:hypothetical protein